MPLNVITLSLADLDAIQRIEQLAYSHPWSPAIMRDSFKAGTPCIGLLAADGSVAAYSFVLTIVDEVQILNITVDPARQGQGLGRALMEHLLADARAQNCTRVLLEVRRSNAVARRLYEHLGFVTIGVRKNYYPAVGGHEDALVLGYEIL